MRKRNPKPVLERANKQPKNSRAPPKRYCELQKTDMTVGIEKGRLAERLLKNCYASVYSQSSMFILWRTNMGRAAKQMMKIGNTPEVSFCCAAATQQLSGLKKQMFINFPGSF